MLLNVEKVIVLIVLVGSSSCVHRAAFAAPWTTTNLMSRSHVISYLSLLDSFFDACEEFTGSICDHTEELATS